MTVQRHSISFSRLHVKVDHGCITALAPRKDPNHYQIGVSIGLVSRKKVVTTEASDTGWGGLCKGRPTSGSCLSTEKWLHINCLEIMVVFLALKTFLPDLIVHLILVWSENMAVVFYKHHHGGLRSRPLYRLARLLLWSQCKLFSLRVVHVLGRLNQGADIKPIWSIFHKAKVDFFSSKGNSHCPIFFTKNMDALAH